MATTQTSIANVALIALGRKRIDSFASGGEVGQILTDIYEEKVEYLLRSHLWNFAIARKSLPETTPAPTWGFSHAYEVPGDFVRMLSIEGSGYVPPDRWQIEGTTIVTDCEAPLKIRYVRRADESEFDSSFKECLSALLAADMALPLTGSPEIQAEMQSEAERKFRQAKGADGQEGSPPVLTRGTWVQSRVRGANRDNTRWGS